MSAPPLPCPNCGRFSFTPHAPVICLAILEDAWINNCRSVANVEGAILRLFANHELADATVPNLLAHAHLLDKKAHHGH